MIVCWKEWVQLVCLHCEKPGFLWTLPHASFSCADFALYHFTVIKHNYGNDYMLWTVSPSSQLVNLGGGHPKHKYYKCLEKLIKRDHILAHKKL